MSSKALTRSGGRSATGSRPNDFRVDLAKYEAIQLGPDASAARRIKWWLKNSELHCVAGLRLAQAVDVYARTHPITGRLAKGPAGFWVRRHAISHHFNVSRRANVGPGFLVMHRTGIWVGDATIGANCVIHHNVTIGQRVASGSQGVPKIGSNVWIGPGAILTGDISVGDGVTISAGTVLSKSVPDRCLVAGNPGRVIQTDHDNSGLINFDIEAYLNDGETVSAGADTLTS